MCTNSALVDSLECYLQEMVDCFEDFVKKSLLIITLAIGALVGVLVYLLKIMNERGVIRGERTERLLSTDRRPSLRNSSFVAANLGRKKSVHGIVGQDNVYNNGNVSGGFPVISQEKGGYNNDLYKDSGYVGAYTDSSYSDRAYLEGGHVGNYSEIDKRNTNFSTCGGNFAHNKMSKSCSATASTTCEDNLVVCNKESRKNILINCESLNDAQECFETRETNSNDCMGAKMAVCSKTKLPIAACGLKSPKSSSKCYIRKSVSSCGNCSTRSVISSCDEVTKDSSDLICSRLRKPASRTNCSSSRLAIPSLATCNIPKRHQHPPRPCSKAVNNRYSCCSVCCDTDPR